MSSIDDIIKVEMDDDEIRATLDEAIRDITMYDGELTDESFLIDDLGMDSLGFLDLFFTLQTAIQREISNSEMRQLILEEFGLHMDPKVQKLSDGEKDRLVYPQLQVKHFFNIIKRQLSGELEGIDLDSRSRQVFSDDSVTDFLDKNLEKMKQAQIQAQLKDKNVEDPRLVQVVEDAFSNINVEQIKEMLGDQKFLNTIVKDFLMKELHLDKQSRRDKLLKADGSIDEAKLDVDEIAMRLLQDPEVQQKLIQDVVDRQINTIFDDEITRLGSSVGDGEIMGMIKDTFSDEFKEDKIQLMVGKASNMDVQGDLVEDFIRDKFDEIAAEETKRLLEDKDTRNKLVQEYIKDNYDPSEMMELNNPEKMKEIQQAITQQYIDDNIDEIIERYMNKYMDEMLSAVPEEEIEVMGDVQDEFMKSFLDKMDTSTPGTALQIGEDNTNLSQEEIAQINEFAQRFKISNPMVLSFLESNFDAVKKQFEYFEGMAYDEERIQKHVLENFEAKKALFLYSQMRKDSFDRLLKEEFTHYFLDNHMDEMMEVAIRQQFSFLGYEEDEVSQDRNRYQELLEEHLEEKLEKIADKLTEEDVIKGLKDLIKQLKLEAPQLVRLLDSLKKKKQFEVFEFLIGFFEEHFPLNEELTEEESRLHKPVSRHSLPLMLEALQKNFKKKDRLTFFRHVLQNLSSVEQLKFRITKHLMAAHKDLLASSPPEEWENIDESDYFPTFKADALSFLVEEIESIIKKEEDLSIDLKGYLIKSKLSFETEAFSDVLKHMSKRQVEELSQMVRTMSTSMDMKLDQFLKIACGITDKFVDDMDNHVLSDVEEYFVFANNYIMETYDFFLADRLVEIFENEKEKAKALDGVRKEYMERNGFDMLKHSMRTFLFKDSVKKHADEIKSQKEFVRESLIRYISKKAKELED